MYSKIHKQPITKKFVTQVSETTRNARINRQILANYPTGKLVKLIFVGANNRTADYFAIN